MCLLNYHLSEILFDALSPFHLRWSLFSQIFCLKNVRFPTIPSSTLSHPYTINIHSSHAKHSHPLIHVDILPFLNACLSTTIDFGRHGTTLVAGAAKDVSHPFSPAFSDRDWEEAPVIATNRWIKLFSRRRMQMTI